MFVILSVLCLFNMGTQNSKYIHIRFPCFVSMYIIFLCILYILNIFHAIFY